MRLPRMRKSPWLRFAIPVSLYVAVCGVALTSLFLVGCGGDDDKNAIPLPNGLKYLTLAEGSGEPIKVGDLVSVHYVGTLRDDNSEFDNTYTRKNPALLQVGGRSAADPRALAAGLEGMKLGGKRKLFVPSKLGYG